MGRLSGRFIALTGAAQGTGRAIAADFLAEGADLFLIDRDAALLQETVATLSGVGRKLCSAADIADADAVSRVFADAVADFGRPFDGLVNNAGVNVFHKPLETSEDEWRRAFAVNLEGAWFCARAVFPGMIKQSHGVILNIASTHAFTIFPEPSPIRL